MILIKILLCVLLFLLFCSALLLNSMAVVLKND